MTPFDRIHDQFSYRKFWIGFLSLIFIVSSLLISCRQDKKPETPESTSEIAADTLPQDFISFFDRFHADSAFQLAHITFPLEGQPNSIADTVQSGDQRYYWTREKWKMHRPFTDPSQQFENWYEIQSDRMIEHWIHMKGTNLYLQRRFAKLNDGWYLIYYAGMRPNSLSQEDEDWPRRR